jgi:hypothetical protein
LAVLGVRTSLLTFQELFVDVATATAIATEHRFGTLELGDDRINSDIRDTSVLGDNAVFFVFFNSWPIIMCKAQNKSGRAY